MIHHSGRVTKKAKISAKPHLPFGKEDVLSKEELIKELREKIITAFGSEIAAASVFENPDFIKKLGEILSWLVGEIEFELARKYKDNRREYPDWGELSPIPKDKVWTSPQTKPSPKKIFPTLPTTPITPPPDKDKSKWPQWIRKVHTGGAKDQQLEEQGRDTWETNL